LIVRNNYNSTFANTVQEDLVHGFLTCSRG